METFRQKCSDLAYRKIQLKQTLDTPDDILVQRYFRIKNKVSELESACGRYTPYIGFLLCSEVREASKNIDDIKDFGEELSRKESVINKMYNETFSNISRDRIRYRD